MTKLVVTILVLAAIYVGVSLVHDFSCYGQAREKLISSLRK